MLRLLKVCAHSMFFMLRYVSLTTMTLKFYLIMKMSSCFLQPHDKKNQGLRRCFHGSYEKISRYPKSMCVCVCIYIVPPIFVGQNCIFVPLWSNPMSRQTFHNGFFVLSSPVHLLLYILFKEKVFIFGGKLSFFWSI